MTRSQAADTFPAQHDRTLLETSASSLTGLPASAGETHLAWLATLTPVTSGPFRLLMHGDGHVESFEVSCPGCGRRDVRCPGTVMSMERDFEVLRRIADAPRASRVRQVLRRLAGCRRCSPSGLAQIVKVVHSETSSAT